MNLEEENPGDSGGQGQQPLGSQDGRSSKTKKAPAYDQPIPPMPSINPYTLHNSKDMDPL